MRKTFLCIASAIVLSTGIISCGDDDTEAEKTTPDKTTTTLKYADVSASIDKYCATCHSGASAAGGVDLSTEANVKKNAKGSVADIEDGSMPPEAEKPAFDKDTTAKADVLKYFKSVE